MQSVIFINLPTVDQNLSSAVDRKLYHNRIINKSEALMSTRVGSVSLEPRLSIPILSRDKIRNGKPGFETIGKCVVGLLYRFPNV